MDVVVSTSDLHAEGSPLENTAAEMSPVARRANAGKLGGRKLDNSLESPLGRPDTPAQLQRQLAATKSRPAKMQTFAGFHVECVEHVVLST